MDKIVDNQKQKNKENSKQNFGCHNPSYLSKYLYKANQAKNEQIVNRVNDTLINLKNAVNKKKSSEKEYPDKVFNIVDKILDSNKQEKFEGLIILTSKHMLQRSPMALAQVQAGNKSQNLPNQICQIMYFLY